VQRAVVFRCACRADIGLHSKFASGPALDGEDERDLQDVMFSWGAKLAVQRPMPSTTIFGPRPLQWIARQKRC
jgi:hypothetical protein